MEQNVGVTDRYVRIVLGAILAILGLAGFASLLELQTILAAILVIVGVVLVGTGFTQRCLVYEPLGIDTR